MSQECVSHSPSQGTGSDSALEDENQARDRVLPAALSPSLPTGDAPVPSQSLSLKNNYQVEIPMDCSKLLNHG